MQKIRKDLFPLAGHGTRFLPMTNSSSKGLIPITHKTVFLYVLGETVEAEICRGTGSSRQAIENHFDTSIGLEDILRKKDNLDILKKFQQIASLSETFTIPQKGALRLEHPVLCPELVVRNEPFAVAHGDLVGSKGKLTEKEEYAS